MSCSQLVRYSPQIGLSVEFLIAHICDVAGERVGHGVGDDLLAAVRQADPVLPPGVGAGPLLLLPEVLAAELVPHLVGELVVGLQAGAVGGGEEGGEQERQRQGGQGGHGWFTDHEHH